MAREPAEEETAGAAALARGCRGSSGPAGARAPRPPLWLLCLGACWLLGAVADADFSILDEAQVLASQMRRLAAEELGVVTMQVSGPFCAPRTCQASCLSPMRRARSHSPVQVPLTTHRPLWYVRSPFSARHLCPLQTSHRPPPHPRLHTNSSFMYTGTSPFLLCRGSCPLHGTHSTRSPHPSTAPLSQRRLSGSFESPSLILHVFPPAVLFSPPYPCKLPSFFVYPSRGRQPRLASTIFLPYPTPLTTSLCPRDQGARMGAGKEGTAACAAAPGPPGSRRRAASGADSALCFPARVHWGRGWPGRFPTLVRCGGLFFIAFCYCCCRLRTLRCMIFVLCVPFGGRKKGKP